MKNSLIFFVLVGVLSSCDSGGGGSPAKAVQVERDATANSCEFTYTEGEVGISSMASSTIKTSIFNKQFDLSVLEAIGPVSASETVRLGQMTGVNFFQVVSQEEKPGCLFADSLPKPPSSIENYFRQAEQEVKKESKESTLLAFYLDQESVYSLTRDYQFKPAIVVKDDSEKYTMVHELMHHLFALQKPITTLKLQAQYRKSENETSDAVDQYKAQESIETFKNLVNKVEKLSKDFTAYLRSHGLEDMAIEHELNIQYKQQSLKYVTGDGRRNGDQYIVGTADKGLLTISKSGLENLVQQISSLIMENRLQMTIEDQSALEFQMTNTKNMFRDLKQEIKEIRLQADSRLYRASINGFNLMSQNDFKACPHTTEAFRFLDEMNSRIPQL